MQKKTTKTVGDTLAHSPVDFDVEAETAKMFPYGQVGDVRWDRGQWEMVLIEECGVVAHEHHDDHGGDEHSHVYHPSRIGGLRLKVEHSGRRLDGSEQVVCLPYYQTRRCNHPDQLIKVAGMLEVQYFLSKIEALKVSEKECVKHES